jgi:hypothetical protein
VTVLCSSNGPGRHATSQYRSDLAGTCPGSYLRFATTRSASRADRADGVGTCGAGPQADGPAVSSPLIQRRIRSGPCFCPQSHYVIILAISRQCPVVADMQMPLTVNTANAHHHERELLHTRCLCTPTMAYAVPSGKRLRTSVGLSRFPDGARAGFIRYSLAPLNCWSDGSAGNTRPRGRRTARG